MCTVVPIPALLKPSDYATLPRYYLNMLATINLRIQNPFDYACIYSTVELEKVAFFECDSEAIFQQYVSSKYSAIAIADVGNLSINLVK